MRASELIIFLVLLVMSLVFFTLSFLHFRGKGFLCNNAYIYASQKEREAICKKPYYRQSSIVFLFVGLLFLLNAIEIIVRSEWLFYLTIALAILIVIYAIASSIRIERKNKR